MPYPLPGLYPGAWYPGPSGPSTPAGDTTTGLLIDVSLADVTVDASWQQLEAAVAGGELLVAASLPHAIDTPELT